MKSNQKHNDPASVAFLRFVKGEDTKGAEEAIRVSLPLINNLAHSLSVIPTEADDAIQDAFVLLMKTAWRYDGSVSFKAWICRLIHSASRNRYRSRDRRRKHEKKSMDAQLISEHREQQLDPETINKIHAAVADLPTHYGVVMSLRYFSGSSPEEIASECNLKVNTVLQRLRRGKEKLRKLLESRYGIKSEVLMNNALGSTVAYKLLAEREVEIVGQVSLASQKAIIASKAGVFLKGYMMLTGKIGLSMLTIMATSLSIFVLIENNQPIQVDQPVTQKPDTIMDVDPNPKPKEPLTWGELLRDDVPFYRGRILDAEGNPVVGAYVKMITNYTWSPSPVIEHYNKKFVSFYNKSLEVEEMEGRHLISAKRLSGYLKPVYIKQLLDVVKEEHMVLEYGYLLDDATLEQIHKLRLSRVLEGYQFYGSDVTNENGEYEIWRGDKWNIMNDRHPSYEKHAPLKLYATHPDKGYYISELMPDINPGLNQLPDKILNMGGSLSFSVMDEAGGPIENPIIRLFKLLPKGGGIDASELDSFNGLYMGSMKQVTSSYMTDENGAFRLHQVPLGEYQLCALRYVDGETEVNFSQRFEILENQETQIGPLILKSYDFKQRHVAKIDRSRLVDEEHHEDEGRKEPFPILAREAVGAVAGELPQSLNGAAVKLYPINQANDAQVFSPCAVIRNGKYMLTNLAPGAYMLSVADSQFRYSEEKFNSQYQKAIKIESGVLLRNDIEQTIGCDVEFQIDGADVIVHGNFIVKSISDPDYSMKLKINRPVDNKFKLFGMPVGKYEMFWEPLHVEFEVGGEKILIAYPLGSLVVEGHQRSALFTCTIPDDDAVLKWGAEHIEEVHSTGEDLNDLNDF